MLDVHAHVLPAIDDGVRNLDESVTVLRGLHEMGFTDVVATPHFFPGRYTPTFEEIGEAFQLVKEALKKAQIPLTLHRGRECYLDYDLAIHPERRTFPFAWKGRRYQLIELPQITVPAALHSYVSFLRKDGVQPILAHAERYNAIIRDPLKIEEFRELGFFIQVDLATFTGAAHRMMRKTAERLLANGRIDVLASDVHRKAQLPIIKKGFDWLKKKCPPDELRKLFALP